MEFEINKDENNNFIYSATHKIYTKILNKQEEETLRAIHRYCEENNIFPNIIDEDKLKLILQLGIQEYNKINLDSKILI